MRHNRCESAVWLSFGGCMRGSWSRTSTRTNSKPALRATIRKIRSGFLQTSLKSGNYIDPSSSSQTRSSRVQSRCPGSSPSLDTCVDLSQTLVYVTDCVSENRAILPLPFPVRSMAFPWSVSLVTFSLSIVIIIINVSSKKGWQGLEYRWCYESTFQGRWEANVQNPQYLLLGRTVARCVCVLCQGGHGLYHNETTAFAVSRQTRPTWIVARPMSRSQTIHML